MFGFLFRLIMLASFALVAYFAWEHYDELKTYIPAELPNFRDKERITTFEAGVLPEDITKKYEKELLRDGTHAYGRVQVKYLPFVIFNVKYSKEGNKTEEGQLLFNLENGEMVLNTNTFEESHVFEDCLKAKANEEDFKLLRILQKSGGALSREDLSHLLGLSSEAGYEKIEQARRKQLVARFGETVRIHLESPVFSLTPKTQVFHFLVEKEVTKENKIPSTYSKDTIRRMAQAAFGSDFAIRSEQLVFMPIFQIEVQNPDGSIRKTFWNAINGRKVIRG